MRHVPFAALLALVALSPPARADVGPPPSCPSGQHRQYLYGHHCVTDGYHLESSSTGVTEIADSPSTPKPPTTNSPTTTARKSNKGCSVSPHSPPDATPLLIALALLITFHRRPRP